MKTETLDMLALLTLAFIALFESILLMYNDYNYNYVNSFFIDLQKSISQTKNHKYIVGKYTCVDFSLDLKKRLEKKGFFVDTVSGYLVNGIYYPVEINNNTQYIEDISLPNSKGKGHEWIRVNLYIDAVSGKILTDKDLNFYFFNK